MVIAFMLYFCFLTEVRAGDTDTLYIHPWSERAKAPSSLRQWQISFLVKRNYDVKCVCGFFTWFLFVCLLVCVRLAFSNFPGKVAGQELRAD